MTKVEEMLQPRLKTDQASLWEVFRWTHGPDGQTLSMYLSTLRLIFRRWFPYSQDLEGYDGWIAQISMLMSGPLTEQAA